MNERNENLKKYHGAPSSVPFLEKQEWNIVIPLEKQEIEPVFFGRAKSPNTYVFEHVIIP
jgi:hypothetical protein